MRTAAQYLRMSTEFQRYSLGNQAAIIAEYAEREGYEITHTYEDAGKSGVTTKKRAGLKSLLRDVISGAPFSTVLVVDVSRWGRYQDPDEAAHYEFLCRDAGVRVVYCAEPFADDGSPTASIVKNLKRVMAAEYSRQLADRCRAGILRRRLAGGKGGGRAPFGFRRRVMNADGSLGQVLSDGERRFHPEQSVKLVKGPVAELRVIRKIFHLFVDGLSGVTDIARSLNAANIPYRGNEGWNDIRVRAVLRNEIAIGYHVFNRCRSSFGQAQPQNPPEKWLRVKVLPPVVSSEIFSKAQAKFAALKGTMFTDDEMLEKLRRLRAKHGYLSRRLIDSDPDVQWSGSYLRRFGSMTRVYDLVGWEGIRRAGEHVDRAGSEPDEIIRRLKEALARDGYLNSKLIESTPRLPSVATIKKRFGSIENAYQLAGFNLTHAEKLKGGWIRRKAKATDGCG